MDRVHYIWLDYTHYDENGKPGSQDSHLVFNGDISLEEAKAMIASVILSDCKQLIAKRSNWFSQKGVEVEMAAQNVRTSKVLYTKVIGIL